MANTTESKRLGAFINEHINTLIRECETKWSSLTSDSHSIEFYHNDDYWSDVKVYEWIENEMLDLVVRLDSEIYEFSYEIEEVYDNNWRITIEWIFKSKLSNPFEGVSV